MSGKPFLLGFLDFFLCLSEKCSVDLTLPSLPESTSCYLSDCTAVDCCIRVDLLDLAVHFFLNIDACNFLLHVGIERLQTTIDLIGYNWGKFCKNFIRVNSPQSITGL